MVVEVVGAHDLAPKTSFKRGLGLPYRTCGIWYLIGIWLFPSVLGLLLKDLFWGNTGPCHTNISTWNPSAPCPYYVVLVCLIWAAAHLTSLKSCQKYLRLPLANRDTFDPISRPTPASWVSDFFGASPWTLSLCWDPRLTRIGTSKSRLGTEV